MSNQYTPGPLTVLPPYTDRRVWPIGKERPWPSGKAHDIKGEANSLADATLWAAAPDLLKALESLADQYDSLLPYDHNCPIHAQALQAIAKAKGGAQ